MVHFFTLKKYDVFYPNICLNAYVLWYNRLNYNFGSELIMPEFKIASEYKPCGDQPKAIDKLCEGIFY